MLRHVRTPIILAVLIGCVVFVVPLQQTKADIWGECDADRSARNQVCLQDYDACVAAGGTNCPYPNACLDESARLHHDYTQSPPTGCLFDNETNPVPWPVISDSRSACLGGCQQGASQIENLPDRLEYYMECWNYCNDNFPRY
jgi:hypothetical protein